MEHENEDGAGSLEACENRLLEHLIQGIEQSLTEKKSPHFTYIIGNNGTGKSRQLAKIADYYNSTSGDAATVIGCISNAVYDRFTLTTRGRIEYLGARTSGNAVFHAAIDRQLSKIILKGILRNRSNVRRLEKTLRMDFMFSIRTTVEAQRDLKKIVDRRKLKGEPISKFLDPSQQAIIRELFGRQNRFSSLTKEKATALDGFMNLNPEVRVYVQRHDRLRSKIDFEQLSTGEQNRALTYAKVLSVAQEGAVILIDEPEISLHLHWQMGFHRELRSLLDGYKSFHALIATHSPAIISEGASADRSDACVVALERSETEVGSILEFQNQRFGEIGSHDKLVFNNFNTSTYRSPTLDIEIAESILEAVGTPDLTEKVIERLESMKAKYGVSNQDKRHIKSAVQVVRNYVPPITAKEDN